MARNIRLGCHGQHECIVFSFRRLAFCRCSAKRWAACPPREKDPEEVARRTERRRRASMRMEVCKHEWIRRAYELTTNSIYSLFCYSIVFILYSATLFTLLILSILSTVYSSSLFLVSFSLFTSIIYTFTLSHNRTCWHTVPMSWGKVFGARGKGSRPTTPGRPRCCGPIDSTACV